MIHSCVLRCCGNGLRGLERLKMAKVGFTAHPMHNSIRNMIGTLVLFCGGLVMSKIRILDSRWIGDFNLEGILVWWEIQITDMASTTIMATTWGSMDTLLVSFFVSHTIKYSLWHYPGALPLFSTGSCIVMIFLARSICYSSFPQTVIPSRLKFPFQRPSKFLNLLIKRPPHYKTKTSIMILIEFCIG